MNAKDATIVSPILPKLHEYAVERVVGRPDETKGYIALVEMGIEDMAFEAVVVRHPTVFSPNAVERAK